jgi:hypothetical protein
MMETIKEDDVEKVLMMANALSVHILVALEVTLKNIIYEFIQVKSLSSVHYVRFLQNIHPA